MFVAKRFIQLSYGRNINEYDLAGFPAPLTGRYDSLYVELALLHLSADLYLLPGE